MQEDAEDDPIQLKESKEHTNQPGLEEEIENSKDELSDRIKLELTEEAERVDETILESIQNASMNTERVGNYNKYRGYKATKMW